MGTEVKPPKFILFQDDWKWFPTAIVDYKTKNTSFLHYSKTLKEMGVKNHLFPLALLQPHLQGIDPFDYEYLEKNPKLMQDIYRECCYNPWYYLREVCRLRSNAGTEHPPVRANRGIICTFWVRLNNISLFTMQPRQTGKSVGADALHNWYMLFGSFSTKIMLLTKDNTLLINNIDRLKKMREILPRYLVNLTAKDKDNLKNYNYSIRESELIAQPAQKDEEGAIKLGRGLTVAILQVDEHPYMKFLHKFYPVALASMNAAIKEAKDKNEPYGVLVTTTAGDLTTVEGKYSFNYYSGGATWNEKDMMDCQNVDELNELIRKRKTGKAVLISACFNHRMLGISDVEFKEMIDAAPSETSNVDRDYFLIWTSEGESPVLSSSILKSIQDSEREPDYLEIISTGHVIKWYIPEEDIQSYMSNNVVVMGADTSEMIDRDSTTFYIQDIRTLATVATIRIPLSNIMLAVEWFTEFMMKYENIVLIMERKSSASTFIDSLLKVMVAKGINPFKRVYNEVIQFPEKHEALNRSLRNNHYVPVDKIINEYKRYFGFNQTGNTRNILYSTVLKTSAKQAQHVVYDKTLSGELRGLKLDTKKGRIDHGVDGHDDMVIAWLLSNWLLKYGNDLDYYGIDSRKVMLNVNDEGKQYDELDIVDNNHIDELNNQIEDIKLKMTRTDHPIILSRYEHQLNMINMELEDYGYEPRNLEAIVREAKEKRMKAGFRS